MSQFPPGYFDRANLRDENGNPVPMPENQIGAPSHDFNPATGMSREQYRDAWMGSGVSNIDQMQQWLAANGGQILSGNGTVQTPYGDTLDMGTAFRTGNGRPGWTTVDPAAGSANGSQFGGPSQNYQMPGNTQTMAPQNQGAMPYNPHAGMAQPHVMPKTVFQQQQTPTPIISPTAGQGSGNGSFLGSLGGSFTKAAAPMAQPVKQQTPNAVTGSTFGAPSAFSSRRSVVTKPLPQNNMGVTQ